MTYLKDLHNKLKEDIRKYEEEHSFAFNSREEFAIPKHKVESAIKGLSYDPITEEELLKILGRKWKVNVQNILTLYNFLRRNKFYAEYSPVMISTTLCKVIKNWKTVDGKKVGTPIFKTPRSIEMIIQKMKDLKCCKCVDPRYAKDIKKGMIYVLSDSRIKSLSLLSLNNITYEEDCSIQSNEDIDCELDVSRCKNDKDSKECSRVFKELRLNELMKRSNSGAPRQFQYKATGWRPSADICYLPSREKSKKHKKVHDVYREDVIPFKYEEFDRNASIYNLQLFLGKGIIRENNRGLYDFYKDFGKRLSCIEYGKYFRYDDVNKPNLNNITFEEDYSIQDVVNDSSVDVDDNVDSRDELRSSVKVLMMSIQFADMRQIRALVSDYVNYLFSDDNRCFKKARKFSERAEAIYRLLGIENVELKSDEDFNNLYKLLIHFFEQAKEMLHDYLGVNLGKSVFLYEAAVNLKCQSLIKEAGYNCVSVYDGFYTDCSEDFWWDCYVKSLKYLKSLIVL